MQNIVAELFTTITADTATRAFHSFIGYHSQWDIWGSKTAREQPGTRHVATDPCWLPANAKFGQVATDVSCRRHCASGAVENGLGSFQHQSTVEQLWQKYFEDPTEWWDNRNNKLHSKSPDFRHKNTKEGLWVDSWNTPEWVKKFLGFNFHSGNRQDECTTENAVLMPAHRNAFSWTASISQYTKSGKSKQALRAYKEMIDYGVKPISYTFVAALKACSILQDLESAKEIHAEVVRSGCEADVYVGTMLVDVYGKCGRLEDARRVFEMMPQRNVVSWNALILGYAQTEKAEEALELYARLNQEGSVPNARTLVAALKACSSLAVLEARNGNDRILLKGRSLEQVRVIHTHVLRNGYQTDVFVGTMLVDAYAKCGSLVEARNVFEIMPHRNVVSWTAMVLGYAQMEEGEKALQLYSRMKEEGVVPDERTFVAALKACSSLLRFDEGTKSDVRQAKDRCLEQVRAIHTDIQKHVCQSDIYVGNILVDVYAKCGSLDDARCVFQRMPHRDVVSWTTMILGYAEMEEGEEALQLYKEMRREGVQPDFRAFIGALKACSTVAALEKGKEIHAEILKSGIVVSDPFLANTLVDMYGKCGSMSDAQQVFDSLLRRDTVTWSALMSGYARQGECALVFDLFQTMRQEGIKPDGITFLSILTVCSRMGLVDKGEKYFQVMSKDYGITPTVDHFTCMVDLFGRAGQLDKAMAIAKTLQPNGVVWKTLLAACQKWSNVKVGRRAFDHAISLDKNDTAAYILMLNIYEAAHMLEKAEEIQAMRVKTGACKRKPGHSWWTDMGGVVHAFMVGDQEHPDSQGVYAKLRDLFAKLEEDGCTPHIDSVVQAISCNDKDSLSNRAKKRRMTIQGTAQQPLVAMRCRPHKPCKLDPTPTNIRHKSANGAPGIEGLSTLRSVAEVLESSTEIDGGGTSKSTIHAGGRSEKAFARRSWPLDEFSWTTLISQHAKCGEVLQALRIYEEMLYREVNPTSYTFVAALKACSILQDLKGIKHIHADVVKSGLDSDVYVGTMLVGVYSKYRRMVDARCVFEKMPHRNVVSWNTIILGYALMQDGEEALQLYERMHKEGVTPNRRTFIAALKACSSLVTVDEGNEVDGSGISVRRRCFGQVRVIHSQVLKSGCELDVFVATTLVDVYAKCGSLEDARSIFEKMPHRNVVSWNAMILGYAQMREGEQALQLYMQMQKEYVVPDDRTFVAALKACNTLAGLEMAKAGDKMHMKTRCLQKINFIHSQVVRSGCELDTFVGTMLVDVYVKLGCLVDARYVFESMPHRNVVSWNAIILGYAQMGEGEQALQFYAQMQQEDVVPDDRTYVAALKACISIVGLGEDREAKTRCLEEAQAIHSQVVKSGCELAVYVGTMLVDVYSKCGSMLDARRVFEKMPRHDVVSWTAIILGYVQVEDGQEALDLYTRMTNEGVVPDAGAFVGALKAAACVACLYMGRKIHSQIMDAGINTTESAVASSLIDMYAKCGSMVDAQQVFEALRTRDVVTWSALLMGYAHQGDIERVFGLFQRMKEDGIEPDAITFLSLLTACSHVGLVARGQEYFETMKLDYGITPTINHYTCMIDLLGRAGQLDKAMEMAKTVQPNTVVWRTVLGACRTWRNVELGRQAFEFAVALDKDDVTPYVLMSNIYASANMLEQVKEIQTARVKAGARKEPGQSWTDIGGIVPVERRKKDEIYEEPEVTW